MCSLISFMLTIKNHSYHKIKRGGVHKQCPCCQCTKLSQTIKNKQGVPEHRGVPEECDYTLLWNEMDVFLRLCLCIASPTMHITDTTTNKPTQHSKRASNIQILYKLSVIIGQWNHVM